MSDILMAVPGRDYPIGYLIAVIFFITAVALFIISFFIKDDTKNKKIDNTEEGSPDESDLYSNDYDTPTLEYSENFADEIIRMIEEEEKSQNLPGDNEEQSTENLSVSGGLEKPDEEAENSDVTHDTLPVPDLNDSVSKATEADGNTIVFEPVDKNAANMD